MRRPVPPALRQCQRLALFVCVASLLAYSQVGMQTQSIHDPALTAPPDKNAQMQMQTERSKKASWDAANSERKRQISDDTTRLLELATQLKAEVDKTGKDTLSLNVIRKAESIEKLAHGVKEKMKLTIGAS
ncbi:hypothetical protein DYQ86_21655 [Acidobacteria bacterium AB60]|nr:hypothetical protein DYQ86_21655 [Acidobacteria bacterium AB60]